MSCSEPDHRRKTMKKLRGRASRYRPRYQHLRGIPAKHRRRPARESEKASQEFRLTPSCSASGDEAKKHDAHLR